MRVFPFTVGNILMKTRVISSIAAAMCGLLLVITVDTAFGRGGRGGGGGFGGGGGGARMGGGGGFGGGGGARVGGGMSGGGMSRPAGGMSRPAGGARPSVGSSPSFNHPGGGAARPSTPAARPGLGAGSGARPGNQPGTRPDIGSGAGIGNRPSTLPSTRPGAGSGIGSGAGIGNRPSTLPGTRPGAGTGAGSGIGNRPSTRPAVRPGAGAGIAGGIGAGIGFGIANRPVQGLPGLGGGTPGSRLPNGGTGLQDRMANRPQTLEDRRGSLNDRLTSGREDRQQNRGDMQNDRQDWRDNNREDWQNFADDNLHHHGDWYNDCWHPGSGWDYMWDNYPGAAALGVTRWGVNRLAYGLGYWGYSNPWAGSVSSTSYSYSEPLVSYSDSGSYAASADPGAAPATVESAPAGPPQPTDEGMSAFEESRVAFYGGDYEKALTLLDTTLKTMPHDTVVHEFRGLVLFALKKYPESAAAVYAVLSAGPGWDWTTMSGLYSSVDVYTEQLRALEDFAKANPQSADASFLIGYHYLTMGHEQAAAGFFQLALQALPDDKLLSQLVQMTTPEGERTRPSPPAPPAPGGLPPEQVLTVEKLQGKWKATSQGAQFELQLAADGTFVWSYSRGSKQESVKGVFAVDQNNLAMEPDAGGTMLAEIDFAGDARFNFKMIGADSSDPGLVFAKN